MQISSAAICRRVCSKPAELEQNANMHSWRTLPIRDMHFQTDPGKIQWLTQTKAPPQAKPEPRWGTGEQMPDAQPDPGGTGLPVPPVGIYLNEGVVLHQHPKKQADGTRLRWPNQPRKKTSGKTKNWDGSSSLWKRGWMLLEGLRDATRNLWRTGDSPSTRDVQANSAQLPSIVELQWNRNQTKSLGCCLIQPEWKALVLSTDQAGSKQRAAPRTRLLFLHTPERLRYQTHTSNTASARSPSNHRINFLFWLKIFSQRISNTSENVKHPGAFFSCEPSE